MPQTRGPVLTCEHGWAALARDLEGALAAHTDDDGVAFPIEAAIINGPPEEAVMRSARAHLITGGPR